MQLYRTTRLVYYTQYTHTQEGVALFEPKNGVHLAG